MFVYFVHSFYSCRAIWRQFCSLTIPFFVYTTMSYTVCTYKWIEFTQKFSPLRFNIFFVFFFLSFYVCSFFFYVHCLFHSLNSKIQKFLFSIFSLFAIQHSFFLVKRMVLVRSHTYILYNKTMLSDVHIFSYWNNGSCSSVCGTIVNRKMPRALQLLFSLFHFYSFPFFFFSFRCWCNLCLLYSCDTFFIKWKKKKNS